MEKLAQLQHNLCDAMDNVMQCLMDVREGCEEAIQSVQNDLQKTRDKIKEEQDRALVDIETQKQEWEEAQKQYEQRQQQAKKHAEAAANVIQLNVGGKNFSTTKNTLLSEPNTFFHAMLHSGAWTVEDGHSEPFFVDRNPEFFAPILDYLRDGKLYGNMLEKLSEIDRERFVSEVEFYSIGSLLKTLGQCEITGVINTIAGNGQAGYSGDGGQALQAELNSPFGVCHHEDQLFIADANNHRIRIVDLQTGITRGKVTTGAGNGEVGSDGDGGLAVSARLTAPNRVAIYDGKMYITEYYENCIRAVDIHTGIITTMAGSGVEGHGGDGGPAIQAQLCGPSGIAISDGKMYFAENKSHCIRMIDLKSDNTRIQTLAGQPGKAGNSGDGDSGVKALLNGPNDIAVRFPLLYFSDSNSHRVRALDLRTNTIKTIAGCGSKGYSGDGGPALEAKLCAPVGLALHLNQLFIADCANHCIRQVELSTGVITTFCGTGVSGYSGDGGIPTACQLASPIGLAVSHNSLFIADKDNNCIRVVG